MNHEGYERCVYLTPDQTQLNYSQADIAAILQRVRDSVPIQPPELASLHSRSQTRGSHPYGYSGNRGVRAGGGGYRRGIRGGYIRSERTVEALAHGRETHSHTNSASETSATLQSQPHVAEPAGQASQEDSRET